MNVISNYEKHTKNSFIEFEGLKHPISKLTLKKYCNVLNNDYKTARDFIEAFCPSLLEIKADMNQDMFLSVMLEAVKKKVFKEEEKETKNKNKKKQSIKIDIDFLICDVMNFYSLDYEKVLELEYSFFLTMYTNIDLVIARRKEAYIDMLIPISPSDKGRVKIFQKKKDEWRKETRGKFDIITKGKKAIDAFKGF